MKAQVQYVDSSVLGKCPASIDMETGVICINKSVWDRYDNFEKAFIIFHELGHYNLDTDNEKLADEYALKHVYKTAPRSLKRALGTLCKIRIIDHSRLDNLYRAALELDAADGNTDAVLELENINYLNKPKKQITMTQNTGNETYFSKRNNKTLRIVRRADGAEETETSRKSHKTNGIKFGGLYFSFTNILLVVLIAAVIWKK